MRSGISIARPTGRLLQVDESLEFPNAVKYPYDGIVLSIYYIPYGVYLH